MHAVEETQMVQSSWSDSPVGKIFVSICYKSLPFLLDEWTIQLIISYLYDISISCSPVIFSILHSNFIFQMCDSKVKISIQCNESSKASLETYFPSPKKDSKKMDWKLQATSKLFPNILKNIKTSIDILFSLHHITLLLCTEHRCMLSFFAWQFNFHV